MPDQGIRLDFRRRARLGLDEAVFAAGKTVDQLAAILEEAGQRDATLLLTRLDPAQYAVLPAEHKARLDYEPVSRTAFYGQVPSLGGSPQVAVVTAGASDVPVSREAVRTLNYHGEAGVEIADVGVAGLWRLLERVDDLRRFPIIIVAAGMDAALSSVIAGLAPGLVIAVPTSVGYGVAQGGETALRAALTSCAPGVLVVNIDNGYGAACAALRALNVFGGRAGNDL